jgi:inner membrane protein involved in colicin E2 resistance
MNAYSHRTWIPFYLLSFGTLSMAVLRSMDGAVLVGSLLLVSVALAIIFLAIQAEVTRNTEKKELMEALSKKIRAAGEPDHTRAK